MTDLRRRTLPARVSMAVVCAALSWLGLSGAASATAEPVEPAPPPPPTLLVPPPEPPPKNPMTPHQAAVPVLERVVRLKVEGHDEAEGEGHGEAEVKAEEAVATEVAPSRSARGDRKVGRQRPRVHRVHRLKY